MIGLLKITASIIDALYKYNQKTTVFIDRKSARLSYCAF
jgi:hypothetical protein